MEEARRRRRLVRRSVALVVALAALGLVWWLQTVDRPLPPGVVATDRAIAQALPTNLENYPVDPTFEPDPMRWAILPCTGEAMLPDDAIDGSGAVSLGFGPWLDVSLHRTGSAEAEAAVAALGASTPSCTWSTEGGTVTVDRVHVSDAVAYRYVFQPLFGETESATVVVDAVCDLVVIAAHVTFGEPPPLDETRALVAAIHERADRRLAPILIGICVVAAMLLVAMVTWFSWAGLLVAPASVAYFALVLVLPWSRWANGLVVMLVAGAVAWMVVPRRARWRVLLAELALVSTLVTTRFFDSPWVAASAAMAVSVGTVALVAVAGTALAARRDPGEPVVEVVSWTEVPEADRRAAAPLQAFGFSPVGGLRFVVGGRLSHTTVLLREDRRVWAGAGRGVSLAERFWFNSRSGHRELATANEAGLRPPPHELRQIERYATPGELYAAHRAAMQRLEAEGVDFEELDPAGVLAWLRQQSEDALAELLAGPPGDRWRRQLAAVYRPQRRLAKRRDADAAVAAWLAAPAPG